MAMTVAKEESQLLVVTKLKMLELLSNFPNVFKEMKVVATRRLAFLKKSIDNVKLEFFGVINDDGLGEKKELTEAIQELVGEGDDKDNFLMKSQFMRQPTQMRQGEITL